MEDKSLLFVSKIKTFSMITPEIRPTNPYISVDLHNHVVGHMSITVSTCLFIFVVAVCQLQVAQKKLFLGTVY